MPPAGERLPLPDNGSRVCPGPRDRRAGCHAWAAGHDGNGTMRAAIAIPGNAAATFAEARPLRADPRRQHRGRAYPAGEDHHNLPGHDDDHARRESDGLGVDGNGGIAVHARC